MNPAVPNTREALLQKALECFRKAGLPLREAECWEEAHRYDKALTLYIAGQHWERAAACCRKSRKYATAADYYEKALCDEEAAECRMMAQQFLAAGEIFERKLRDRSRALRAYELGRCFFEAARLVDRHGGDPERALAYCRQELDARPGERSARRARTLLLAAALHHARGEERAREELVEQAEQIAEALAAAGNAAEAGAACEALGDYGVRAERSAQTEAGYHGAVRHYRAAGAGSAEAVRRVLRAHLAQAKRLGNRSLAERLEQESAAGSPE